MSDDRLDMTRREAIILGASVGGTALAGCSGRGQSDADEKAPGAARLHRHSDGATYVEVHKGGVGIYSDMGAKTNSDAYGGRYVEDGDVYAGVAGSAEALREGLGDPVDPEKAGGIGTGNGFPRETESVIALPKQALDDFHEEGIDEWDPEYVTLVGIPIDQGADVSETGAVDPGTGTEEFGYSGDDVVVVENESELAAAVGARENLTDRIETENEFESPEGPAVDSGAVEFD